MVLFIRPSSSMTAEIVIVLILLLTTVVLFASERLSVEVITRWPLTAGDKPSGSTVAE